MNKLKHTVEKLSFEELMQLKREIESGKVEQLINSQLERFKNNNQVCPVCNTAIRDGDLTLMFGPENFRKKASFCATDCLEYFIGKLKRDVK